MWSAPVDEETARFLGFTRVLTGDAARLVGGAGRGRVAVRPSAVRVAEAGPLEGAGVSASLTPDGTRLVVRVPGIGEIDASAPVGWQPPDGGSVRLEVLAAGLAHLAEE